MYLNPQQEALCGNSMWLIFEPNLGFLEKFSTLTSNMEMHFLVCTWTAILDFILKLTLDLQLNMNIQEVINVAIHIIYTNNCFLHMQQHHTN